ncbi:MAG TPA: hypothetical protein VHU91_01915 [Mycobacteriales bacterium]|jgi:hypothetical protein|nr:hypothetical protein [Mycobacteriales bacterium]
MPKPIALVILVVATAVLAACGGSKSTTSERAVLFEVTGRGPVSVYYGDGNEPNVTPPWKKTVTERKGIEVSVVATALQPNQEVTCRISVDGKRVVEQTADVTKCEYTLK